MKAPASVFADMKHVGPIRIERGHELFRSCHWTNTTSRKLVRLSSITGTIGDCRVKHRYVRPWTILVSTAPVLSLDDYQRSVTQRTATEELTFDRNAFALLESVGELSSMIAALPHRKAPSRRDRDTISKILGQLIRSTAVLAHLAEIPLSSLPRHRLKISSYRAISTLALTNAGAGGRLATLMRDERKRTPAALADCLGSVLETTEQLATRLNTDLFNILTETST